MFNNGFFGNVFSGSSTSSAVYQVLNSSSSKSGATEPGPLFFCVVTAIVLGFLISVIYMITHKKEGYSQSYVITMIMLPAIVSLILLLINTTAGALSLAGAFTLVRFRSVAGDPKDISYIFFSMATGVACGMGYVGFPIVFFIIMGIIMCALN